jgi:hypothetical protein
MEEHAMKFDIIFVISIAAILTMIYCLYLVATLKKDIPGGIIGSKWNFLMGLVVLFTLGYLTLPFFGAIPEDVLRLIVAGIFFFGAIYVMITIKLFFQIIKELSE